MKLAFTGHRPAKLGGYDDKTNILLCKFARTILRRYKPRQVISGMALGWDTAVAESAILLDIKTIAAIPFVGQESKWPVAAQESYRELLKKCHVKVVSPFGYAVYKMQKRNEWMVDHCNLLIALWDGSEGGTANCVRYATSKGVKICNVWNDWKQFLKEQSCSE